MIYSTELDFPEGTQDVAYIPTNAEWYVADVVIEIRADGDLKSRVWVNTHLIRADSPEEAFGKAERHGRDTETSYINIDGGIVVFTFRGISSLQVVFGSLEDGEEIGWAQYDNLTPDEVEDFITPKEELAVFAPIEPEEDSRYRPKEFGLVSESTDPNDG